MEGANLSETNLENAVLAANNMAGVNLTAANIERSPDRSCEHE